MREERRRGREGRTVIKNECQFMEVKEIFGEDEGEFRPATGLTRGRVGTVAREMEKFMWF